MEVHVIRHTPVNFDKNRCYGQLEVPLAGSFSGDVKLVQQKLAPDYDQVFSSPKTRCTQLAEALGFENLKTDLRLLELNFGDWEGQLWSDIDQNELNTWMADFVQVAPSGGESFEQLFLRVSEFMDTLREGSFDKVLIITHAGVIRSIWSYLLEIPLQNAFKIPVGFHEQFVFKLGVSPALDAIVQLK